MKLLSIWSTWNPKTDLHSIIPRVRPGGGAQSHSRCCQRRFLVHPAGWNRGNHQSNGCQEAGWLWPQDMNLVVKFNEFRDVFQIIFDLSICFMVHVFMLVTNWISGISLWSHQRESMKLREKLGQSELGSVPRVNQIGYICILINWSITYR